MFETSRLKLHVSRNSIWPKTITGVNIVTRFIFNVFQNMKVLQTYFRRLARREPFLFFCILHSLSKKLGQAQRIHLIILCDLGLFTKIKASYMGPRFSLINQTYQVKCFETEVILALPPDKFSPVFFAENNPHNPQNVSTSIRQRVFVDK